jgi:hypothetical protein
MQPQDLTVALSQFTGTTTYTKLCPKTVLTDGALFLAQNAECFWLMDVFASHLLCSIDGDKEPFTCLNLTKTGDSALVIIDDGNGVGLASQEIEYTDFPLNEIKLYGCWSEEYWVLMLPSEY